MTTDWFSKTAIDAATTMLTEPFVHDFVRANIWHVRGRDADLDRIDDQTGDGG